MQTRANGKSDEQLHRQILELCDSLHELVALDNPIPGPVENAGNELMRYLSLEYQGQDPDTMRRLTKLYVAALETYEDKIILNEGDYREYTDKKKRLKRLI